ncbi:DedA family protein [Sporolactobacillus spathodeae]|uniref:Membrane protein DedA with SNARE-associated domain n=1 Tax=Sporolactobacillus spathodeae TaxID=1465502 RepID=A0ABS2QBZ6_9BACL|nr:DedA family protein [Sporolactobacillus spathodeae]MBM7658950.1 membrane protein DedA with SNARE-associated domain [Sporolactobacillus spathodeae]
MAIIQSLFDAYGSIALYLILFSALIGIPCAEESVLFLCGTMLLNTDGSAARHLPLLILTAILGASSGMVTAFLIGYYIGKPFLMKYGGFIGLTEKRCSKAESFFIRHAALALITGYFIPGVRQMNPYLAGISRFPFRHFLSAALIGASLWSSLFILSGYFLGEQIGQFLISSWTDAAIAVIILCTGVIVWRKLLPTRK